MLQSYQNFEIIIMDGGISSEIKSYVESLHSKKIKLFQNKDSGIYDAMNKGLDESSGSLINFLNTDDCYSHKNVLNDILNIACISNRPYIIKGLALTLQGSLKERLSYKSLLRYTPNHQSVFYSRSCFDKFIFNKNFKLASDWAHFYEINYLIDKFYIDKVVINYKEGGIADNKLSHLITWKERLLHLVFISEKNLLYKTPHIITSICGILYSKFKIFKAN